jgi:hypothetical protein
MGHDEFRMDLGGNPGEIQSLRELKIDGAQLQRRRKGSRSGSCRELGWQMLVE